MPEAMSEKRGLKGLEEWGRKVTDGYRDVKVENLTSSWRDGLAFCAIIHHFRPDLLDFNSLSKENVFHNNSLAFGVAEKQLGVPALLDAEDMVKCTQPDRLSIATYLSQLYQHFEGGANKKYGSSKAILKRPLGIKSLGIEPPSKMPGVESGLLPGRKYDLCQSCKHRVFILERLVIDSKLYHRTCFKCFRCGALLKPGAYNEGETPGLYECTVCPRDEEGEFKTSKMNNSFKNDNEEKEPKQEAGHKSLNDVSKVEENMVLSNSFHKARRNFLQNDLSASDHLETKCATQDPNDKISNLKTDNAIYGTNTPRLSQQTLNTENSQMQSKLTEQSLHQHNETPHKTLLGKPPIAKKPDVLHISKYTRSGEDSKLPDVIGNDSSIFSIRKKSLDGSDQRSIVDLETNITTPQEGYKSLYNRQKLKPLKIELHDSHYFNPDAGKTLSPNSAQLDLPVIKSTNYHTPFVSKNLTRTKSESNFQQTQKLSMLSEALNIPPRKNESVDDLEKVLHGKWSKQSNYPSMTKFQKKDFSSSRDLDNIAVKGDDEVSSSEPKLEEVSIVKREANETDSTLEESTKDSLSESIEVVTKIENEETNINRDLIIESPSVEVDAETIKSGKVEVSKEAETLDSINEDSYKNLKDSSLDISLDKDVSSITDTHSTCTVNTEDSENREEEYPDDLNPFDDEESEDEADEQNEDYPDSLNPFESSDDEEDLSAFRKASTLPVTSNNVDKDEYDQSLNPFSSDEDEDNVSEVHSSSKSLSIDSGCADSLISTSSPCGTRRKKKAPPPPPTVKEIFDKTPYKTKTYSNTLKPSPRSSRKRTAPKPPAAVPNDMSRRLNNITCEKNGMANEKKQKEKDNMNIMKSNELYNSQNKQWRKKKRPAPSVPVPPRRQIKMIPLNEILSEMAEIEVKQQELENQGRNLELLIRDYNQDSEPSMEEEEAIMQLFELVNQKNILFRRQAELMYIKRSQRLEEEQVELEFQIRCLMSKPASKKSENDNQREEELLQRLLDVVEQRNEIVDSIEMDRKREVQEDQSIQEQTEQKFIEIKEKWSVTSKKKDKHKHKKDKKKKASKEESEASSKDHKQKKKKNWF